MRRGLLTLVLTLVVVAPAGATKWWLPPVELRPPASVTSTGRGFASIELMYDRKFGDSICWTASVRTAQRPFGIFIRRDRTGAPDPSVLKLSTAANSPIPWQGSTSVSGCARVAAGVVAAIRRAPSRYYLDVPTPRFPKGELRARLGGPVRVRP